MSGARTVMVTGAAGNLGRAVAAAFGAQGAHLALVGRDVASLRKAFGDEGSERVFIGADLLDVAQAAAALDEATKTFERIDVWCHLVGGFRMGEAVHQTTDATWDFLLDLNARSLVHTARSVVPHMLQHGGGKIVTVGAFGALHGSAHTGAYGAAKSSVIRLTESMAAELRTQGINVNCVLPTIIDTPENRAAMPDADPSTWVAPQDLASVIVFLASDAARAVHGAAIPVTGLS